MIVDDLVIDTLNGLVAFVVPGADKYSVAQGTVSSTPGGIEAGITPMLVQALDTAQPSPPGAPPASAQVAQLLNQVAQKINPDTSKASGSAFAQLSFAQKAAVFAVLEQDPSMEPFRQLAPLLLFVPAVLTYSEAGKWDFAKQTISGRPIGWDISNYSGVADGRDEFKGYLENRRQAAPTTWEDDVDA